MEQNNENLFFDNSIKKIEFLYRYAGINIRCEKPKKSEFFKNRLLFLFNFLWFNIDVSGAIFWFIDGIKEGKDFLRLTYAAPCISLSTLSNVKGIYLVMNTRNVNTLIERMRRLQAKQITAKYDSKKEEIIKTELKFLNSVLNIINALYVTCPMLFAITPLMLMALNYSKTNQVELLLPFLILYPFDSYQIKVWPFVYIHQIVSETIMCINICASDHLFLTCCSHLCIQFRLIQQDIKHLITVPRGQNTNLMEDEQFKRNFREIVILHQELIACADMLEIIYSKSTLFNFLSSSTIICLTGFNVTLGSDLVFVCTFLSFLFMSLMQIFFLCFFADMLMTSSMELSDAVYESMWYMGEAKIGKQMLLILTRSQRPCKLTASGFADVNLKSFMRVLSTAWSYFALLQTIYSG